MKQTTQPHEWKLQQLVEQKRYQELSVSEKEFVSHHISPEEYNLRYQLIHSIQEDKTELTPAPLILPKENNRILIPLYQTILAVAATVLLMLFLKSPLSGMIPNTTTEQIRYISVTDTIKEIEYIYDTVYREVEKTKVIEKNVYVSKPEIQYVKYVNINTASSLNTNKVLNAPNNYPKPDLKSIINEVDGSESLAQETSGELFKLTMYRD